MYDVDILNNCKSYQYFLKYFNRYNSNDDSCDLQINYFSIFNDKGLDLISKTINPARITSTTDELTDAFKLMEWTFNHMLYPKVGTYTGAQFSLDIIEFAKQNKAILNCLCHATVLTELLLAAGYKAKKVFCLSCDVLPSENHVVVDVYINSIKKWVMLDPTISAYFTDENDIPLSVREIRLRLISDSKIKMCYYNRFSNMCIDNSSGSTFNEEEYISYLYKDFFRFLVCKTQHSGFIKHHDEFIMLVPEGYLIPGMQVYNYAGQQCVAQLTTNSKLFWE